LMVAALFRNFLLAQRIMRVYHCHPQSYPEIPSTHDHPLWQSWDLAVESILSQLPDLLAAERGEKHYEYQHSNFFAEQLTAFEVYLSQGGLDRTPPAQLPVVLQVLLSQVHRLRALILLSKFLDLGPWAVHLALSIGIFPYVLKLLQSQAMELKPVMVFIWARILACDQTCQQDLLKDNGYQYFTTIMNPAAGKYDAFSLYDPSAPALQFNRYMKRSYKGLIMLFIGVPVGNVSEHRAMCAFIISMFCKDFHQGQVVCNTHELIDSCIAHLHNLENPLLRQWSCLCISRLWADFPEGKWTGIRTQAWQKLCELVVDPVAEVRTAMLCALTTFLGVPDITPTVREIEENIASVVLIMAADGNSMVRKELLVFYSVFIDRYMNRFIVAAYEQLVEEQKQFGKVRLDDERELVKPRSATMSINEEDGVSSHTVYAAVWKQVLVMSVDPFPEVAREASIIVDCVFAALTESPLSEQAQPLMNTISALHSHMPSSRSSFIDLTHTPAQSQPTTPPSPTKQESYLTASLKRTASVAASLKNFAFGTPGGSEGGTPNVRTPTSARVPPSLDGRGPLARQRTGDWNLPPDIKDHHAQISYPALRHPEPKYYKHRDVRSQTPSIPLKSGFFDWCAEYFREPQMKPSEADEPGSEDYNQRLWRRNRNDKLIMKTQPLKEIAGTHPWEKAKAFFNNGTQPQKMIFHQFEDHLIVSDDRDGINVWDWKKQARLNRFSNGNPIRSRITEIRLINEDDQALLMTGSSDGVVKIFKNYEVPRDVEMVTSFRALTDLEPSTKNAGLVFDWQQSRGLILVAGDVRSIRVWNAGTEICTTDINARSGSPITSLTSDQVEGHLFVAGFGDGALRLYDQRQKPQTAMVQVWKEHKSWVTNVHLQRGGQRELVSACRNGEVKFWDMRWDKSFRTVRATRDTLRTLSVHEHAPVLAVGTDRHVVKVFSMMGLGSTPAELEVQSLAQQTPITPPSPHTPQHHRPGSTLAAVAAARANASAVSGRGRNGLLNTFEPYSGFLNPGRWSPINCTSFHPHRMMVAGAAYGDTHVNIFACSKGRDKWLDEGEERS
jgi:regulator-associated protein of mTOR